mgnify:CR=1 FL=1
MDSSEPVIETQQLTKIFSLGFLTKKAFEALSGVSLKVLRGRAHGFLGPNGAGKTTTIKILNHLIFPTAGQATLFGKPPGDNTAKQRLGYLPENPTFPDHLTGEEVLTFYGQLVGLSGAKLKSRTDELLEVVKLAFARKIPVRRYSKGMTQKLGLASCFLADRALVFLDEPMSGLDPLGNFVSIAAIAGWSHVMIVSAKSPIRTLADFVKTAKDNPGKLSFGFGLGTAPQIVGEYFKAIAGIDVIGDYLTEINVTSPTGLQEIARFDGVKIEQAIWDSIEAKVAARPK